MKITLLFSLICFASFVSQAQRSPPLASGATIPTRGGRCYPIRDDSKIGIVYGAKHNLFGARIRDVQAWRFGLPLMLTTDLEYRVRHGGNEYFNVELMRDGIISLGKTSLAINLKYKSVSADKSDANNEFIGGASFSQRVSVLTFGYARRNQRLAETSTYGNGLAVQLYHEFFEQLDIQVRAIYWFDDLQYSIKVNENIFQSRFTVGLGYEKIGSWDEFDIALMYTY